MSRIRLMVAGVCPRAGLSALLSVALAACGGGGGGEPVAGQVRISMADATVSEGNAGTSMRALTVTLSEPSDATVTVGYASANGTATTPADYGAVNGALTFAPGNTTATISLPVVGDTIDESNETVLITLSDPQNGTLEADQATVTIQDDDGASPPSLSIGNATVTEGNGGSQAVSLTVSLSAASTQQVSVTFATANGTATAGSDYTGTSGTLTFSPGQTTRSATVTVLGDTVDEANETVLVNLSGPVGATVADGQGVITITDDDGSALPAISIANASVAEGNTGTRSAALTVSLSTSSAQTVTVAYSTANGTATAGSDYASASSTVSFSPGQTSRTVNVTVNGDTADESDETVLVNLASPVNATIADAQAVLTITDDDGGFGLDSRPSNPDCVAPARGTAATGVATVDAFPAAPNFSSPTKILQAAHDSRWYVLEQAGRIRVFSPSNPGAASTWLDLSGPVNESNSGGLLGLAFHPDFPATPEIYVSYTGTGSAQESRISRFILDDTTSPTLAGSTEQVLLRVDQSSGTHKGGDIAFGPDGALYVSIGDASANNDPNDRGQDTTRLAGKFLRLGVLGVGYPSPGYTTPAGNPFAGNPHCGPASNAQSCPEIYAIGFRNPWRWSFDEPTGELWVGDVGERAREEINRVTAGGNYGWSCREGTQVFNSARCDGGPYIDPVYQYVYGTGGSESVTGGVVYRGTALPALSGRYVFADFVSGRIWALAGSGPYTAEQLLDTTQGIVAFALGLDGEVYYADYSGGTINKLVPAGGGGDPDPVPDDLADTGCFGATGQPVAGLVPYDLNAPFWSDNAVKSRWIGLPNGATITRSTADWSFPTGTVLVKTFRLGGQPIETRLLMRHPDGGWAGYTYEWNGAGTAATRVRGGKTTTVAGQQWLYPSESQCMQCHTSAAGFALGPETRQFNRSFTYPSTGRTANQLETLDHIGMFSTPLPGPAETLATMANPADAAAPVADRARAWLHSNCAGCHRPSGPTTSSMDLLYATSFASTNTCDELPAAGSLGVANARLIAPGDAARSIVIARMARRDADAMPPLGSFIVDDAGEALLSDWVNGLSACP